MIRTAIAAALIAPPASAQISCGPAIEALRGLVEDYGETPLMRGTFPSGARLLIFINEETGTWTAVEVDGALACQLAQGLEGAVFELRPQGDPA